MITSNVDPGRATVYRRAGFWGDAGLHDYWHLAVLASPDKEAVVDSRGSRFTYAQIDDLGSRVAGFLHDAGVRAGDVVSVQLPNWAEFVLVNVACLKLGAAVNPVVPQDRYRELRYRLTRCASAALVMPTQFRHTDFHALADQITEDCPDLRALLMVENGGVPAAGHTSFDVAIRHAPLPASEQTPAHGTDVASVLFTSGSEADPKGVMLTHDNVLASERAFAHDLGIGFPDRVFMPAPLAHATGYLHGVTMSFLVGGTLLLLDVFTGPAAVGMANAERATYGSGSPTIIREMFDVAERCEPLHAGLRVLCCHGAPVPRELAERGASLGVRVISVYGSTESAPHTLSRPDDPIDCVINTDGRPNAGTSIKIVDPRTRVELPIGQEGEEASRGPGVFVGYLGAPDLTAAVLDADGWYYSGDLATVDNAGYVRITGRIKDVIVRGGENISATEAEAIMRGHPAVKDVAVVAMPHARLGEQACAYVLPTPGVAGLDLAELRRFFIACGVAKYKIPERVEIVESLPMTESGKVRKVELRERIAAKVAAENAAAAGNDEGGTGEGTTPRA